MGKESFGKKLIRSKAFGLLLLTIVLVLVIVFAINKNFIARGNVRMILINITVPCVMLASVGPLLIAGGIDLSASAQAALGSMIFAQVMYFTNLPWGVALLIALASGACFGLINIFLTNVLNFMPFIATIGMSSVYSGFAAMWTKSNDVMINRVSFTKLGGTALIGKGWIPVLFIFAVVLVLVYVYVLANTRFGRSAYMVGGNPQAARLAGLDPKKVRGMLFINSSVIAVLSGVVWSAFKKMASPSNITTSAPSMSALTALILGGVSFMGGSGSLFGGIIALLLLQVFDGGLIIAGMQTYVNTIAQGLILIIALIIDSVNAQRQRRALLAAAIKAEGAEDAKGAKA